jgi:hypothetical protein
MSNCDKLVTAAAASQGCDCIKYDAAAGTLTANGVVVPLSGGGGSGVTLPISPTSTGLSAGALNPAVTIVPSQIQAGALPSGVTVPAAQITGVLPAAAIPCAAVLACLIAGSIPASAIAPGDLPSGVNLSGGTAGQVYTSDGVKGAWAAPASTPAGGPISPTASGIAAGALNPLVTVDGAQITGTLPSSSIPCSAVLACLNAAPNGTVPAAAIAPGTTGQVLTTDATGKAIWSAPASTPAGGPISPTSSGISGGALNPAVTIVPSQLQAGALPAGVTVPAASVTGTLADAAIPCSAVLACLAAAPAGSLPVNKLAAGTTGQVLTTDASGAPVWAAPAATPAGGPISPTSAGIAAGALNPAVTVVPSQLQAGALPSGVTVDAAQVTGVLPAAAIPCSAVLACLTAGSLPASAIAPGTSGQVLTTNASGATVWAAPAAAAPVSPTASGISAGALNPAVTVDGSQITGTIPATAIPCSAVLACITNAPAGSIPASKLAPGTSGQVLTTDASGATVWAAASGTTAAGIATAMNAATVTASPGTAASVAQVYGENAAGAPVTATPMQVFEAGMAAAPLSTAAAPVVTVSGVNAAGTEVKTTVQPLGTKTVGVSSPATNAPATAGANYVIATVVAPEAGMYSVQVNHSYNSIYAGGPAVGINANQHEWYITTSGGRIYDRIFTDYAVAGAAQPAGANVATDTEKLTIGQFKLNAGENVLLQVYVNSATAPHNLTAGGGLTLIKGADNDLATPSAV